MFETITPAHPQRPSEPRALASVVATRHRTLASLYRTAAASAFATQPVRRAHGLPSREPLRALGRRRVPALRSRGTLHPELQEQTGFHNLTRTLDDAESDPPKATVETPITDAVNRPSRN